MADPNAHAKNENVKPQNAENHAKIVPAYHVVLTLLMLANLAWAGWRLITTPSAESALGLSLIVALVIVVALLRLWPLKVQDRLIRLEERLRMRDLLPPDLFARIEELRSRHFIALRFASDEELPELVRRVLDGELETQKEIKQAIRVWRPDHFRV